MFNLAIDSKLRGCDPVSGDRVRERVTIIQSETNRPVQYEVSENTPNLSGRGSEAPRFSDVHVSFQAGSTTDRMFRPVNMHDWFVNGFPPLARTRVAMARIR